MPTVGQLPAGIVASLGGQRAVDRAHPRARTDGGAAVLEGDAVEAVEIDDDRGGARRAAVVAVTAGAGDERDVVAVRPPDDGAHVVGVGDPDDRGRPDVVVAAVEDDAGGVVAVCGGRVDAAADGGSERARLLGREAPRLRRVGAGEQRGARDEQRAPRDPPRVNSLTVHDVTATVA